jgi:transcriptional regulator with XRE-family HTH domain
MSKLKSDSVLMTQAEIAKCTGISQPMISRILRGDKQVRPESAVLLELCTGICREAWFWPEEHWNPYMPFTNETRCLTCHKRFKRLENSVRMTLDHFRKAKDMKHAFKYLMKLFKKYYGASNDIELIFAEVREAGLHLICSSKPKSDYQSILTVEEWPWLNKFAKSGKSIFVDNFPGNLRKSQKKEIETALARRLKIKAMSGFSCPPLFMAVVYRRPVFYPPEMVGCFEKFMKEFASIYRNATLPTYIYQDGETFGQFYKEWIEYLSHGMKIEDYKLVYRFNFKDPDISLLVDTTRKSLNIRLGDTTSEVDIEFYSPAFGAVEYWKGNVELDEGIKKKLLRLTGKKIDKFRRVHEETDYLRGTVFLKWLASHRYVTSQEEMLGDMIHEATL